MKFVSPSLPESLSSAGERLGRRSGIPQWLKEWLIDNKGKPVLLTCGCKTDMKERGTLLIVCGGDHAIYCVECDDWKEVDRTLTLKEMWNLPPIEECDTPMF